jgi:hypothetical protein
MNDAGIRFSGWTRSAELKSLAKPLAFLFALLFSLTVYVNAALAAGSDNTLCVSVISIAKNSKKLPSEQFQLDHCGNCLLSTNDTQLGLPPTTALLLEKSVANFLFSPLGELVIVQTGASFDIRAPPSSIINKS